jgi:hypothetical protein
VRAIEVARELSSELADGAVFVDLAPLARPALVEPTLATVLGVDAQPGETARNQLNAHLRGRELLLVLDNFERLLDAAPLVAELLAAAPRLCVLTTSRTPLKLSGEHEYQVPPLAVPDASSDLEALARNDSVAVFAARASALSRNFVLIDENAEAVATICRRLDGLPLALELAAARVNLLSVEQIVERLDRPLELLTGGGRDLPERQKTLRATIDWSHELLDTRARSLFARLAVFGGGCTLAAAESVCGAQLEPLAALLDAGSRSPQPPTGNSRCSTRYATRARTARLGTEETRERRRLLRGLASGSARACRDRSHSAVRGGSPSGTGTCVRPLPPTSNSASASRLRSVRTGTTRTAAGVSWLEQAFGPDRPPRRKRNRVRSSCSTTASERRRLRPGAHGLRGVVEVSGAGRAGRLLHISRGSAPAPANTKHASSSPNRPSSSGGGPATSGQSGRVWRWSPAL